MRSLILKLPLVAAICAAFLACSSSSEDDADVDVGALQDDDLAKRALTIMGAPGLGEDGQRSCGFTGCHSINPVTLRNWAQEYRDASLMLDSDKPSEEKINAFRADPHNPVTGFTPERLGVMAAGVQLGLGANVKKAKHPLAFAQGEKLAKLFEGKPALYDQFRSDNLMPVDKDFTRLSAEEYEIVLTWFSKGMPKLDELVHEANRPTSCTDDFEPLKKRTSDVKNRNWEAQNKSNRLPMFACDPGMTSATQCFNQTREGKEVFPSAESQDYSKGWGLEGSNVRTLRKLSAPNYYWLRSSADGRFAMTGGGRSGGAQAIDLKATLEGGTRDIGLNASYDPDFWPDNRAFMFQGGGAKLCAQSLLERPEVTQVTFGEPECSQLTGMSGLYQTVGQQVGDDSIADRFITISVWAGDVGSYGADARDTPPKAGSDAALQVFVAVAKGNDEGSGYQILGPAVNIPTPYQGDTMMGRSGRLIGSRVAGLKGSLGYSIDTLEPKKADGRYKFLFSHLGQVCMKGNKANFSFDERFLATHHYNEPEDFANESNPAYREKGSADIYVADFVTGKKARVTKMQPGQFALYAHFRSDGWLYFLVVDRNTSSYYLAASDWAIRQTEQTPTP